MGISHEAVVGKVESWSAEDGWGVLRTPNGLSVFCHVSHLDMAGYRSLTPGSSVYFDYEQPGQDGCDARVLTAARLAATSGQDPPLQPPSARAFDEAAEHGRGLTIVWDDDATS